MPHPELPPVPKQPLPTYRRTIDHILHDTTLTTAGCWEYHHKGATNGHINSSNGYGYVIYHGKQWPVHRLIGLHTHVKHPGWRAWLASQRWIHVCHTCDNPPCINPSHLKVATAQYNTWDSIVKGNRANSRGSLLAQALGDPVGLSTQLEQDTITDTLDTANSYKWATTERANKLVQSILSQYAQSS